MTPSKPNYAVWGGIDGWIFNVFCDLDHTAAARLFKDEGTAREVAQLIVKSFGHEPEEATE